MTETTTRKGKTVGAVANAVAILRCVAAHGTPLGVNQIARATGVSASTCFNILGTLAAETLVDFDPLDKTYRLGLGVVDLAAPVIGASSIDQINRQMARLAQAYNCLFCLWHITDDERIVLINKAFGDKTIRIDVRMGARLPAFAGAVGRCYAAHAGLPAPDLQARFARIHWHRPPDFATYRAEVRRALADGYAFDRCQLFNGLETAASIITDAEGRSRYGLTGIAIVGQMPPAELERMGVELRNIAGRISRTVFGSPA